MESKWFVDENVKNIDKEILLCFGNGWADYLCGQI